MEVAKSYIFAFIFRKELKDRWQKFPKGGKRITREDQDQTCTGDHEIKMPENSISQGRYNPCLGNQLL